MLKDICFKIRTSKNLEGTKFVLSDMGWHFYFDSSKAVYEKNAGFRFQKVMDERWENVQDIKKKILII
jgi:hypothetical protein